MKNILFTVFLSLITITSFAQKEWCATDEMLEDYFHNHPGEKERFFEQQLQISNNPSPIKGNQNSKAPTIIVPVVVHVIHYNGAGNVLKAQIDDGIRVLNEDFQKLNSDTTATRTIFQSVAADSQMEFRLAKIDPNGNCTEGINRVNSFLTYNKRNEVKALSYWDATKYLNVWLVNTIAGSGRGGGTTLGYAQFPGTGLLNTFGLVVRHDEWGTIGTAAGGNGRTATHEVGHCFNLLHTFQSGCGVFCNSSGDFVCDTPPAAMNTFGCNTLNNQCSNDATGGNSVNPNPYTTNVPDQLENYMSYDDCQTLFTEGQKSRMQTAFSIFSQLNSLRSAANLIATGTNNGYVAQTCPPIVDVIDQDKKLVCQGGSISFSEQSYNGPITTYDWEFPGATPNTSSSATPTVTYNTAGVHNVILRASNSAGADTLVIQNLVYVDDTATAINAYNYVENFDGTAASFNANWITLDPSGDAKWIQTSNGSVSGSKSLWINNFTGNTDNEIDQIVSPSFDMTQVIAPTVKFKLAYKNQTGATDGLKCAFSLDCGQTWITRLVLSSSTMNSGTVNGTSSFVPNSTSDWRDFTVTTTAAIRNSNNVLFRFDFTAGGGNNLYIDNLFIDGASAVGIDDVANLENSIQLFPNPVVDGTTSLIFTLSETSNNSSIYLSDIMGKRIQTIYNGSLNADDYRYDISTSELSPGLYFISIETKSNRITKKLLVR